MRVPVAIDKLLRGPWLPILVAVVAALGYAGARAAEDHFIPLPPPPPPDETPYTDEARTLLRGLDVGDAIQGWRVADIRGPIDRGIVVTFENHDAAVTVVIARRETRVEIPPQTSGPYGIYVSSPVPPGVMLEANAITNLSRGLSLHIERAGPVPEGM